MCGVKKSLELKWLWEDLCFFTEQKQTLGGEGKRGEGHCWNDFAHYAQKNGCQVSRENNLRRGDAKGRAANWSASNTAMSVSRKSEVLVDRVQRSSDKASKKCEAKQAKMEKAAN